MTFAVVFLIDMVEDRRWLILFGEKCAATVMIIMLLHQLPLGKRQRMVTYTRAPEGHTTTIFFFLSLALFSSPPPSFPFQR